jgi:ribosomal protein S3
VLHLSFFLKDSKVLISWFKTMILRISFWKTRSIFRFVKYLMLNFFLHVFPSLKIKGLKVKLKGKISSAGNSRKKSIIYRVGKTSHSEVRLKVLQESDTVITFTGVMGLTVSLFY